MDEHVINNGSTVQDLDTTWCPLSGAKISSYQTSLPDRHMYGGYLKTSLPDGHMYGGYLKARDQWHTWGGSTPVTAAVLRLSGGAPRKMIATCYHNHAWLCCHF